MALSTISTQTRPAKAREHTQRGLEREVALMPVSWQELDEDDAEDGEEERDLNGQADQE